MEILIPILSDIVRAEYAQWMRYTYLSSLGFGLHTDTLATHFEEHAQDELEHAELISRWIVDFGGAPPTDLAPVEQFCGSVEESLVWLAEAEMSGIHKYNDAYAIAAAVGIHGLENDIANIISKEHEHLSDLTKYVIPSLPSGESSPLVIIATKIAQTGRNFIDYVGQVLSGTDIKDMGEAREYVKARIIEDVEPAYDIYRSGDESAKVDLSEWMWYYQMLESMSDDEWEYMLVQALDPEFNLTRSELDIDEEIPMEEVLENTKQIEPPKQRRPVEKIMVKPPQGTIEEPASVGSYVYSRSVGSEGQIKEILSEDKVRVINTKNGREEVWPTKSLHLSNKPH